MLKGEKRKAKMAGIKGNLLSDIACEGTILTRSEEGFNFFSV